MPHDARNHPRASSGQIFFKCQSRRKREKDREEGKGSFGILDGPVQTCLLHHLVGLTLEINAKRCSRISPWIPGWIAFRCEPMRKALWTCMRMSSFFVQQKPLKELGLCLNTGISTNCSTNNIVIAEVCNETRGALPLLQVWPSDSPRADTDEQAPVFVFPDIQESVNDSGIESIQASPSPCGATCNSPAMTPQQSRRASLLHPDHARLQLHYLHNHHNVGVKSPSSPDKTSLDEDHEDRPAPPSPSSSTTSSLRSMPSSAIVSMHSQDRRRSSSIGEYLFFNLILGRVYAHFKQGLRDPNGIIYCMIYAFDVGLNLDSCQGTTLTQCKYTEGTSRCYGCICIYSMFDALDLEYALLRAAARGSVGPYSLSESLHKLTFTQSLAFPALARGLAAKQSVPSGRSQQPTESGLNAFAKVVTAMVLMLVSVLVFGVVYKFAKT
ncbi:hypothetical protein ALC53_11958 [Atta colombica]|uniref:Uncharacterized protein n=1 Tax=Atta colombica TaxID=520822 RepID=A0A195AZZ5_9HYME|nr:hypothetical protein ALC53_11958 [Atta colombica]